MPSKAAQQTTTTTRKKAPKIEGDIDTEPLKQMFIATHSEKFVTIKFGNASFGIKKDNTLEKFMRGTENKDNENISKILDLIKNLMKLNISTEHIADRFNTTQQPNAYSQTIKQFLNALNKPLPIVKKVLSEKVIETPLTHKEKLELDYE